jgi:hypothetical protein
MQTVQETRRRRVGILKAEFGTWAKINELLGWEPTNARLSQIHKGTLRSDRGTPYTMGDDTARLIEQQLRKPTGWMDTPPEMDEPADENDPISKAMHIMQAMEPEARYQALRLLDALAQPPSKNGTEHH